MGILIAIIIIAAWFSHLYYILNYVQVNFTSVCLYLHAALQTYLYTGLFITAHDAMHGTISKTKIINNVIGNAASILYAGLSYNKLKSNHYLHHRFPGEKDDPDFCSKSQNFFVWWMNFMFKYTTILQLIIMAAAFNILELWFPQRTLLLFWVLPAILSSLQLFYFGTYRPHKYPHAENMKPHNARSQVKNHLWAMISCYFFGYHYEHHSSPQTPWWKLHSLK